MSSRLFQHRVSISCGGTTSHPGKDKKKKPSTRKVEEAEENSVLVGLIRISKLFFYFFLRKIIFIFGWGRCVKLSTHYLPYRKVKLKNLHGSIEIVCNSLKTGNCSTFNVKLLEKDLKLFSIVHYFIHCESKKKLLI